MTTPSRICSSLLAVVCVVTLTSGCDSADGGDGGTSVPMGWVEQQDEESGVGFALPPPVTGPEDTRREGRATAIASHSYAARSAGLTLTVQLLSTPESPEALARELPPERMPSQVIQQVRAQGDYDAEVLSNDRLEELDEPTYDAHLELSSDHEEAVWWMRTHALDDVVVVTQVVAFVDKDDPETDRAELEAQAEAAFRRLNQTVELP